jgi:hypothetical protein
VTSQFEGPSDARQKTSETAATSRFRPRYRALSADELALHDSIKSAATALEGLIGRVPAGRESALAITKLEESVMWAVKALTK